MDINLPMNPPVNNNLQETVYDKLDAIAFEKTRVMNCQLDTRLYLQEKILNKHRKDAQRIHDNQRDRLRREFKKIHTKKPDYVYDDTDLVTPRTRELNAGPIKLRSLSESNVANKSMHCKRYYAHHYHVKYEKEDKTKDEKQIPHEKTDFFNLKLKLFFYNTMKNIYDTQKRMKDEHEMRKCKTQSHDYDELEAGEPRVDTVSELPYDDVFESPRQNDVTTVETNQREDDLQNSTNSLWAKESVVTEIGTHNKDTNGKNRHMGRRDARTLRMYGSDTVLNHVRKKRRSLDEKQFAKKRDKWLQTRQSSDKMFSALN